MAFANLFIVGSIKSGTSSLFKYFESHKEIYVPRIKELHFFTDLVQTKRSTSNTDWRTTKKTHSLKVDSIESYNEIYSENQGEKYLVDASPTYCIDIDALEGIRKYNPEARIILFVRDPIERLKSHLQMAMRIQNKNLNQLLFESEGLQFENGLYLKYSSYHEILLNLLEVFDSKKILIISSQAFFENQIEVMQKVYRWLELDYTETNQIIHSNNLTLPNNWKFLRHTNLKRIVPSKAKISITKFVVNKYKMTINLPENVIRQLESNYQKAQTLKKHFYWIE